MKVIVKDIEVLCAMHGLKEYDSHELDCAGFKFGWCSEMLRACGKVFNYPVIWSDRVEIYGYSWAKQYLIILEDDDDL